MAFSFFYNTILNYPLYLRKVLLFRTSDETTDIMPNILFFIFFKSLGSLGANKRFLSNLFIWKFLSTSNFIISKSINCLLDVYKCLLKTYKSAN